MVFRGGNGGVPLHKLLSQEKDLYSKWPSRSNYYFSAYTTHNRAQHKVYTKNSTSIY